jgi:hypothetical protein
MSPTLFTLVRMGARKGGSSGLISLVNRVGFQGLLKGLGFGFRPGAMGFLFPCCWREIPPLPPFPFPHFITFPVSFRRL